MRGTSSELFVGVDFGGTKIAVVVAGADGQIVAEGVIPTLPLDGPEQAVRRTHHLLEELCTPQSLDYRAIGIGLPGLVDREAGTILFLPNLPVSWRDFKISAAFAQYTERPVYLLSDARMATLGEFTYGSARGSNDLLVVTVGTGIGGGLVLDGRLRLGAFGAAGEIGHHTILPEGPPCSCGANGCLETLVSGPKLAADGRSLMQKGQARRLSELTNGDPAKVTATLMAKAARSGDQEVAAVIERAAEYLGIGIANAITITAVTQVVIGGGLVSLGELLLAPVRRVVRERVRMFPSQSVEVNLSVLGEKFGALGGVALAAQEYQSTANLKLAQTCRASA